MPSVSSALRSASSEDVASAKVLGIGFPYISTLRADLYRPGLLDFVEITPELLCRARRDGEIPSMDLVPDKLDRARAICGELPIVVHGVELSIGPPFIGTPAISICWNGSRQFGRSTGTVSILLIRRFPETIRSRSVSVSRCHCPEPRRSCISWVPGPLQSAAVTVCPFCSKTLRIS